jgi:cytochrome c-type biogenesis protein CcmH
VIIFWLVAAELAVAVVIALLFVLPPLMRKMQKKPPVIPTGLMATLMSGRAAAITVGIAIPVLSIVLYLVRPNIPSTPPAPPAQATIAKGEKMPPDHAQVVEDMAARLELNPNDGNGWSMLGQSYAMMGRYADAVKAYEKAVKLIPNNAQLLVDFADVLAVANDRNLLGKPVDLINQALKLDPNNIKGLALIGSAAFQAKDYAGAIKYWEKMLKLLPPDTPLAKQMTSGVAEARAMIAGKKSPSFETGNDKLQTVKGGAQITGVLTLSKALTSRAAPNDSVFLSAKDMSGAPVPIAVMRATVKDLPLKFTLDDSMSMMPEMKLSNFQVVIISAKISRSGNTKTQSGDLHGEVASVKVGDNDVRVLIDKVAP